MSKENESMNGNRRTRGKRGQGESSIYQTSDGRWRGALSQSPGMPRKYFRGRTAEDVRKKIRMAETTIDKGLTLPDETVTLERCFRGWMDAKKGSLRRSTIVNYESTFRRHVLPVLGRTPIARLKPAEVTHLYSNLRDQGVKTSALVHAHRYLNNMLRWAHRMDLVPRVVTAQVDAPREDRTEMRFLDEVDSRRLLTAAEHERLRAVFHLLLGTGVRIGEALAVEWGDLEIDGRKIRINKSLVQRRGGMRVEPPKTPGSIRSVPVPDGVLEALAVHRAAMNKESLTRGENWTDNVRPVFVTANGTRVSPSNFSSRVFKPVVEKAGIKGRLRVHDLRHSYASLALSRGASIAAVSKALGHQRISTTLDMYVHALPSDVDQLSDIMGTVYG